MGEAPADRRGRGRGLGVVDPAAYAPPRASSSTSSTKSRDLAQHGLGRLAVGAVATGHDHAPHRATDTRLDPIELIERAVGIGGTLHEQDRAR